MYLHDPLDASGTGSSHLRWPSCVHTGPPHEHRPPTFPLPQNGQQDPRCLRYATWRVVLLKPVLYGQWPGGETRPDIGVELPGGEAARRTNRQGGTHGVGKRAADEGLGCHFDVSPVRLEGAAQGGTVTSRAARARRSALRTLPLTLRGRRSTMNTCLGFL
jgi:hypothetical protein